LKDALASCRRKARLIAELRYKAIPELLDSRGRIIAAVHPVIEEAFKHWRSDLSQVVFLDDLQAPTSEFAITPKKMSVIFEDPGSVQSFYDRVEKYLRLGLGQLSVVPPTLERVGVRFVEILELAGESRFDRVREHLIAKLHQLPDLPLVYEDSLIKLVHSQGYYQVGPIRRGEAWVEQLFKKPDVNVPTVGVGFDIDSFAKEVEVRSADDVLAAVRKVAALTKSIEEQLGAYLGILDG
jgi:hypothetical protein